MEKRDKNQKILIILIVLTLCFIWGNSLLPASISGAFSDSVKDMLNTLIGSVGNGRGLSGDGHLRKVAHVVEFAALGAELTILFWPQIKKRLSTLLLCGLSTALVDETIQLFADGRGSQVKDIWIDFGGFIIGILLCLFLLRQLRKRGGNGSS